MQSILYKYNWPYNNSWIYLRKLYYDRFDFSLLYQWEQNKNGKNMNIMSDDMCQRIWQTFASWVIHKRKEKTMQLYYKYLSEFKIHFEFAKKWIICLEQLLLFMRSKLEEMKLHFCHSILISQKCETNR